MTQQSSTGSEHTDTAAMRKADTANGEGPDGSNTGETPRGASPTPRQGVPHPTGERQAEENADNEPPA